jgi:hypothetical protein
MISLRVRATRRPGGSGAGMTGFDRTRFNV